MFFSVKNISGFSCIVSLIYYPTHMIRKSHSWSLTWTRDKSADQSGPSIVSLSSGQSGPQAHNAGTGFISHFELRISYVSGGSFTPNQHYRSSDVRIPFAIVRVLFAIIRISSRTFTIIRDIFTPLPPTASGQLSITPRSTFIHERSTCVHEQSLNVQPFWRPLPPRSPIRNPHSPFRNPGRCPPPPMRPPTAAPNQIH